MKTNVMLGLVITCCLLSGNLSLFVSASLENQINTSHFNIDSNFQNHEKIETGETLVGEQPLGFDLVANEVYLSTVASDWEKNHVVQTPTAGSEVYIHWVYTIYGSGSVNPLYNLISLKTTSGHVVLDDEHQLTESQHLQAGYIYRWCYTNPWTAPGGNYNLKLTGDKRNDIPENNEGNNVVQKSFSVTPTY